MVALVASIVAGLVSTGVLLHFAIRFSHDAYEAETRATKARTERDGLRRQLQAQDVQLASLKQASRDAELRDRATQAVIRNLQQQLAQQAEVVQIATDTAEAIVHEHARLTDALQDACALLEGKPAHWREVGDRHGVPAGAPNLVDAVRSRVLAEFRGLIAEVQAGIGEHPHAQQRPRQPPMVIERQLRVVAGREAQIATPHDPLHTTGPIGA